MTSFSNILIINSKQEISFQNARHVSNPSGVHVVHVLEGGALVAGDHVHEGAGGLGPAQHEPEALLALVKHALTGQT